MTPLRPGGFRSSCGAWVTARRRVASLDGGDGGRPISSRPSGWPRLPSSTTSRRKSSDGRPVGDDAELPREQRQLVQVVRPRHPPAEEPAQGQAHHLGDALVPAERGHLAHHPVAVRLRVAPEVLREPPRLAERVLARRRVGQLAARVRDARAVAERPHVLRGRRTRSSSSTSTRPRSSSGRPSSRTSGCGLTPAVQTSVRVGMRVAVAEDGLVRGSATRASCRPGSRRRASPARPRRSRRAAAGSRGGSSGPRRRAPSAAGRPSGSGSSGLRRRRDRTAPPAPRRPRSPRRRRRRTAGAPAPRRRAPRRRPPAGGARGCGGGSPRPAT